MTSARAATCFVVQFLVSGDIAQTDESFAYDSQSAITLGRGRRENGRIGEIALWGKLVLITSVRVSGILLLYGRLYILCDAESYEGRLGVIDGKVATETEDELCPEFLFVSEELAKTLEELAVLDDRRVSLVLAGGVLCGAI